MIGLPDDRSPGNHSIDAELGPPVLLKRLGNALEANLARARLESAGIPSFIAGPDAFSLGVAAGRTDRSPSVGLFVPERCVAEALDVLDRPPLDEDDAAADDDFAAFDDPGRPIAFRAFVASVAGWTIVFLTIVGLAIAVPTFVYAIVLALRAVRRSTTVDRGLRLQVAAAIGLAVLGLAMAAFLAIALGPR